MPGRNLGGELLLGSDASLEAFSTSEINAQTAGILGLTVPPMLLARADEVIE